MVFEDKSIIITSALQFKQSMQSGDRKQSKIFQLTSYSSLIRLGQRENSSLSVSRGKKYFKIGKQHQQNRNQILNSFAKRSQNQQASGNNDYGFGHQLKQKTMEGQRSRFFKDNKVMMKNDQPQTRSKNKILKNTRPKKYRKYSDKTNSLDSVIRFNDYITPKKHSFLKNFEKSTEPPSSQATLSTNSKDYKRKIERLQRENEYYSDLYLNSQQRIESLKKENQDQKEKYERVRKMYQQKISQMTHNKECCQKNLGHVFSYDNPMVDIIPDEVIVQKSIQCSTDDLRPSLLRKQCQFNSSKLSVLSLNSR